MTQKVNEVLENAKEEMRKMNEEVERLEGDAVVNKKGKILGFIPRKEKKQDSEESAEGKKMTKREKVLLGLTFVAGITGAAIGFGQGKKKGSDDTYSDIATAIDDGSINIEINPALEQTSTEE